jgi:hypothetical protein
LHIAIAYLFIYFQMKNYVSISLFLLFSLSSFAQNKYDYVWQMGYDYVPKWGFSLNFNNNVIRLDTFERNHGYAATLISMSDKNGNFIFTSNGCKIYNKNLSKMENGDSINLGRMRNEDCDDNNRLDGLVLPQIMTALPQPMNDSIFYVFHASYDYITGLPMFGLTTKLFYTVINMNENNGLGSVKIKNKLIVSDTLDGGNISSVRHANGKDWWVITRKFRSNSYYTLRFTQSGIDTFFTQSIGNITLLGDQAGGQGCFSPDGTKYVYYSELNNVMLYDFDRNTGLLSNFRNYIVPKERYSFGGAVFSPSNRYLYIFTSKEIIQFDLKAIDIPASMETVAIRNGVTAPLLVSMAFGQLAPDCKIYITYAGGAQAFGYIRYPDRKGVACQVVQAGIRLPFTVATAGGLPNNPNYRLGVIPTYPCDSTIDFRVPTKETFTKIDVNVFPNPSTGNVTLDWDDGINTEGGFIRVFNMLGQLVFQRTIPSNDTRTQLELNVPSGVYHIRINFQEHKVFQGKVLIAK